MSDLQERPGRPPTRHAGWPPRQERSSWTCAGRSRRPTRAALRAEGDQRSHRFLVEQLAALRPRDAVLSEEGADDPVRLLGRARLDHRPARRHPRVRRGAARRLGRARRALGARRAGRRCRRPPGAGLDAGHRPSSGTRPAPAAGRDPAGREPDPARRRSSPRSPSASDAELVPMGSAGVKAMRGPRGEVDAYVHAGGQYEWDSAAPVAVARAAGLHTSRIDGSPLRYNQPDPLLPDLLVCRCPTVAQRILERRVRDGSTSKRCADPMTELSRYQLTQLQTLEAEAIHIIREVVAEFERPVLLFSGGKDSIVMLRLAEKAFYPARIPFPVMHVDTGHNFPEVLAFRDKRVKELGVQLIVASVQDAIDHGIVARAAGRHPQPDPDAGAARRPGEAPVHARSSAAPGATRTRPGPRSGSSPSATSSASGTRRTSGPSCGTSTTAGSTWARASGSSRCRTGPSWTSGSTSPGGHRAPVDLLRARPRGVRPRRDALRHQRVLPPQRGTRPVHREGALPHRRRRQPDRRRAAPTPTPSRRSSRRSRPPGSPSGAPPAETTSSVKPPWKTASARGISKPWTFSGSPPPAPSTTARARSSGGCCTTPRPCSRTRSSRSSGPARTGATSYVNLALLTDGLRAEREQGITIDVAYRYFATPKRKFIIADTPGHIQYTRNMVTGASTADLALVLVDARKGIIEQSRRHSFLATLLEVPHLVLCINKMDLVDYDEDVYNRDPRGVQGVRDQAADPRPGGHPGLGAQGRQRRPPLGEHALVRRARACCTTWRTSTWPATAT